MPLLQPKHCALRIHTVQPEGSDPTGGGYLRRKNYVRLRLQFGQVGDNFGGVSGHVRHVVRLGNHPGWVDQVGEPFRKVCVLMIGCTHDFVRRTDDPVSVGEQRIVKRLRVFERLVVRRSIERCSEDVAVGIGKVSGSVTQGLSLNRSTRGGGLRVPPQEHPVSSLIGERHEMAILVG